LQSIVIFAMMVMAGATRAAWCYLCCDGDGGCLRAPLLALTMMVMKVADGGQDRLRIVAPGSASSFPF